MYNPAHTMVEHFLLPTILSDSSEAVSAGTSEDPPPQGAPLSPRGGNGACGGPSEAEGETPSDESD